MDHKKYIAIARPVADAISDMTMMETKIIALAMSKLRYMQDDNDATVKISRDELIDVFGGHRSARKTICDIRYTVEDLCDRKIYRDTPNYWFDVMNIVDSAKLEHGRDGMLIITFTQSFMQYIQGFEHKSGEQYITILLSDILSMPNTQIGKYAYNLYLYLRLHCDTRKINTRTISKNDLRLIMGISPESYTIRSGFERYALIPALQILSKTKHITVLFRSDDIYQLVKDGRKISYKLDYKIYR